MARKEQGQGKDKSKRDCVLCQERNFSGEEGENWSNGYCEPCTVCVFPVDINLIEVSQGLSCVVCPPRHVLQPCLLSRLEHLTSSGIINYCFLEHAVT